MSPTEDMARMTHRIVGEALDGVRVEAGRQEIVSRVYSVPQEAAEAAQEARDRLEFELQDSPEMPGPGSDQWTRPVR